MRIAVASEGLKVAKMFDHAESYTCYTIDDGIITACQNVPAFGNTHPETASMLASIGVSGLIVGLIPEDVAHVYCSSGVEIIAGAKGGAREVVEQYLTHTLIGVDEMCRDDDFEDFEQLSWHRPKASCAI